VESTDLTIPAVACAITHDLVTAPAFPAWWTDHRADHLSGYVGLYNAIAAIAAAIETVPALEEVFIYDLAMTVAAHLLALPEDVPADGEAAVAAVLTELLKRYADAAPLPFARYCAEIDRLCRQHLVTSWADLAGDMEPLQEAHAAGTAPLEFVKEFREHYELEWRD
jgi:hypothetical protein